MNLLHLALLLWFLFSALLVFGVIGTAKKQMPSADDTSHSDYE